MLKCRSSMSGHRHPMGSFLQKKLDNVCNVAETCDNWITNHLIISYSFCALPNKVTHITSRLSSRFKVRSVKWGFQWHCCYRIWLRCEWLCGLNNDSNFFVNMKLIITSRETSEATCQDSAIMRDDLANYPVLHFTLLDEAQKE